MVDIQKERSLVIKYHWPKTAFTKLNIYHPATEAYLKYQSTHK